MKYETKVIIGVIHEAAKEDLRISVARMLIDFEIQIRNDIDDDDDAFLIHAIGIVITQIEWQKKLITLIVQKCESLGTRLRVVLTFIENEKTKIK